MTKLKFVAKFMKYVTIGLLGIWGFAQTNHLVNESLIPPFVGVGLYLFIASLLIVLFFEPIFKELSE
jgi:hypothetical protein